MGKQGWLRTLSHNDTMSQKIEIQNPRRIGQGADSAKFGLDLMEQGQKRLGPQGGCHFRHAVDIPRLVRERDGRAFPPARARQDAKLAGRQDLESRLERRNRRPMLRAGQIGTEAHKDRTIATHILLNALVFPVRRPHTLDHNVKLSCCKSIKLPRIGQSDFRKLSLTPIFVRR